MGFWGSQGVPESHYVEKGRNLQCKYCSRDEYVSEWINVDSKKHIGHTVIMFCDKTNSLTLFLASKGPKKPNFDEK